MSKPPSLRAFQKQFPTEDACLEHLMRTRFGERHDCAGCGKNARYHRVSTRRSYVCEYCGHQVYPTAGTPFDRTRTPLTDWFFVMWQFCTSRHGVAAKEVERQLGVTYKTAWRMCHMIREYMGAVDGEDVIGGMGETVEIDDTLYGGTTTTGRPGPNMQNKTVVIGMVERGGNIITRVVTSTRKSALLPVVINKVAKGSTINTDMGRSYQDLWKLGYKQLRVNHRVGQYATGDGVHTQTIEGFWSQLKRGINGTHIHVSSKHLSKYLGEFEFRYNMRHRPEQMLDRLLYSFGSTALVR